MSLIRQVGKAMFATADRFLPNPDGPRILIYHQVGAGLGRQMEVTADDFIWQLDWLAQNREVVSLDEALNRWDEEGADNIVVLTFDDGYRDTHSRAFPLMKERGFPFTLYLATDAIESRNGPPGAEPLTWSQVEEMMHTGLVTIGAHTHTHPDLRELAAEVITQEVEKSNNLIKSRLGIRPLHFAYPWGYWSARGDPIVRRHYSSAVLGARSIGSVAELDEFLIHRYPIQKSDGSVWFAARLSGGLRSEEAFRRRLRRYSGP